MSSEGNSEARFNKLKEAFEKDGFHVHDFSLDAPWAEWARPGGYVVFEECLGITLEHQTAVNAETGRPKIAYYLEGSGRQMGFLMGLMAEPDITIMADTYSEKALLELIDADKLGSSKLVKFIQDMLIDLLGEGCESSMKKDIPETLRQELKGMVAGCQAIHPATKVTHDKLWALNFGIDFLFSHLFTGSIFKKKCIPSRVFKIPVMCNAFSLFGESVTEANQHFFGRDFMFPTGGVFQNVACLIMYNPSDAEEIDGHTRQPAPLISQAAPGFVGSIAAMNAHHTAMGVDVFMSSLCNPKRPGLNSLAMVRHCIQYGRSTRDAVEIIRQAPRGVSWFYPVASSVPEESTSGWNHDMAVVEAGANIGDDPFPYFQGIPKQYKKQLPTKEQIESWQTTAPEKGMLVRDGHYRVPAPFLETDEKRSTPFNRHLWKAYNRDFWRRFWRTLLDFIMGLILIIKKLTTSRFLKILFKELRDLTQKTPYDAAYFSQRGYINVSYDERRCPGPFYFAPQRETDDNLVIVANHPITPEMRLTAMADWISTLSESKMNGFQWRYDELNNQILRALRQEDPVTFQQARELIDYLRPNGDNPNTLCRAYYNPNFEKPVKQIPIEGTVTLFELTQMKCTSHSGYFEDEWVTIHFAPLLEAIKI